MNILAIDTSGRDGSLAALIGETRKTRLIRQTVLDGERRTAQALAPALHDLLADVGWSPRSVGLVAVAIGPGSFTGLRIGVTTAKVFAYGVSAQTIGVNTLSAMAAQAPPAAAPLWTVLDAQRQELFAARFVSDTSKTPSTDCATSIVPQDAWLAGLQPGDRVTGPPLRRLAQSLPQGVLAVPQEYWQPMADAVGRIAWQAYQSGHRDDLWKLVPHYYRPSYAEEKLRGARSEERDSRQ